MTQKRVSIEHTNDKILRQISAIFNQNFRLAQDKSNINNLREQRQTDERQKKFLEQLQQIQGTLLQLSNAMQGNKTVRQKPELQNIQRSFKQTIQDIRNIVSSKSLPFKINRNLEEVSESLAENVKSLRKDVNFVGESKFLCCGSDGLTKFKNTYERYKPFKSQLYLLSKLQAKSPVQTYIAPEYRQKDFTFIKDILLQNWPSIIYKEVPIIKTVQKQKVIPQKVNRLLQANQYIHGINREQNPSFGLKIYHEEAIKQNPVACSYLGQIYEEGILLPKSLEKSKQYYLKAINGREPYAMYRYGLGLMKGYFQQNGEVTKDKFLEGFNYLQKAADSQNQIPEALVELGQLFEKGKFDFDKQGYYTVDVDTKRAINYYMKARQMNLPRASNNLGVLFINNKQNENLSSNTKIRNQQDLNLNLNLNINSNINSNIEKGIKYLQEAQTLGFPQAYYNIGHLYESGLVGRRNIQQSLTKYYQGGMKGDIQSQLRFAYQLINQTSIMKEKYQDHYKVAERWLDAIAHRKDTSEPRNKDRDIQQNQLSSSFSEISQTCTPAQKAQALYYLGLMYENGFGVDRNKKKAYNYYSQSNNLEFVPSKNKVGDCYYSGFGVKQDKKIAFGCYLEAAKAKNSDALVNLGMLYIHGVADIVPQNYKLAYKYLTQAVEMQNSNAMVHLSYMYKLGLGMKRDPQNARRLLQQSANLKNPHALYILKELGGEFDQKVLFQNIDNETFIFPKKINLKEPVPYLNNLRI